MAPRDTTVAAAWRQLVERGYAPSSASQPDRICTAWHNAGKRESMLGIADHEACIVCYPTHSNGAYLPDRDEDGSARQVVDLTVTAYLQNAPREFKAIMAVLERYGVTGGPYYQDGFGDRHFVLQWHDEPIYEKLRTRLCFESDDACVAFRQAIHPGHVSVRNEYGGYQGALAGPIGTYVIPIGFDWKNGHILDTPRRKLPEIGLSDAGRMIEDCEVARWGARPLALAKDAA